jgi:alkyldihydroxyacetonephosphate synthase
VENRIRNWWGWGFEDSKIPDAEIKQLGSLLAERLGSELTFINEPDISDLKLREPRIKLPERLAQIARTDARERALHSFGRSFQDICRILGGSFERPVDAVIYPQDYDDITKVMEYCDQNKIALIPFGGGSSVVGGVNSFEVNEESYKAILAVDLTNLNKVLDIDLTSRSALIQGGALGPILENQLKDHGLTLRHFPQSFECSSLGGWLATRSGGHFATLYTHIDDLVESIAVITPSGYSRSFRLPGSGAGPSFDRLWLGSEGAFGIITEAWMRIFNRPKFRASLEAYFSDFNQAINASREIAQSGLYPSNARLLDPVEALVNGLGDGMKSVLLIGFESHDHELNIWLNRAREIVESHKAELKAFEVKSDSEKIMADSTSKWRSSFIRMPYLRDALVRLGLIVETFETSITWDKFPELHKEITACVKKILADDFGQKGWISCRFTHVYPDGPAPYYSVLTVGKLDPLSRITQWQEIKSAVSDILIKLGATITHHHAVGRDHIKWYEKQVARGYDEVLKNVKKTYDPNCVMNPGVLIR